MLFLLRQRLVLLPWIGCSLVWAMLLVSMTLENGKGSPGNIVSMILVSMMCGLGTVVLVVGPAFMIHRFRRATDPVLDLAEGERVLFVATANHFLEGEGRGGKLIVTDRRIAHRPHRYNVQLSPWSIPFEGVRSVRDRSPLLLAMVGGGAQAPTFLAIETEAGATEKLVVPGGAKLVGYLDALRVTPLEERPARSSALASEHGLVSLDRTL